MTSIGTLIFYIFLFISVYVQVFFFVTFLENRKKIVIRKGNTQLENYPGVTLVVPCWNEERTVEKTIRSIFALNYPQDKIKILLVDDGSTDDTYKVLSKFASYSNVRVFHKKNGGKYTALNLGLKHTQTEFFGGLDADSYADPESLSRIMSYFEKDPLAMAVAPSVVVSDSKNFIQNAQKAEYNMGVYLKKMFGFLGAINVTPGPLTIFRKKVFDDLGPYRHGHNTEDMEIAYRMQKNSYKITHCNDAYVYTKIPGTVRKLYKQRLRWIYGFINNTIDYRHLLFKEKYGNFSIFTLPNGIISIMSVTYLFFRIIYNVGNFMYSKILQYKISGFHLIANSASLGWHFDPFFINTSTFIFLVILVYFFVIFSMVFGSRMTGGKWGLSLEMLYFFPVFTIIAPFWLVQAVYNTILQRTPDWR